MFSCVWLHFKKNFENFFLVFGKKEGRDKTQKKNHQIRSNWKKKEEREATGFDEGWDRTTEAKARSARCFARSRSTAQSFSLCVFVKLTAWSTTRSLSFSLCVSVSSLCASQFQKSFEVKIGTKMNFRGQRCFFTVNWKWFLENSIFKTNQTVYFTKNDFLKPFHLKQTHQWKISFDLILQI